MGAGEAAPSVIGLVRARVGQAWGGVLCLECVCGGARPLRAPARFERAPERRPVARAASLAGSSRGGAGQPEGESDWQLGRRRAEPSPGSCCYGGTGGARRRDSKGPRKCGCGLGRPAGARSRGAHPEEAPAAVGGGRSPAPAAPRALVSPDGSCR